MSLIFCPFLESDSVSMMDWLLRTGLSNCNLMFQVTVPIEDKFELNISIVVAKFSNYLQFSLINWEINNKKCTPFVHVHVSRWVIELYKKWLYTQKEIRNVKIKFFLRSFVYKKILKTRTASRRLTELGFNFVDLVVFINYYFERYYE